jgi:GAF domain-containing protein
VVNDEWVSDRTAAALERLAGLVLTQQTLHSVLETTAELTKGVMPGGPEVSVSLLIERGATTAVYTGQLALDLDETQYGQGHGPCLQAAQERRVVEVEDSRSDERWPDYMKRAVQRGALSSISVPLNLPDRLAAALNIYAREPQAFDDASRRTARRLAEGAGAAVSNMYAYQSARELADNLEVALSSRAVIDQAKGILMERHKITADQAFELLARVSSRNNTKLREVAEQLVHSGELPGPRPR